MISHNTNQGQTSGTTILYGDGQTVLLVDRNDTLLKLGKNLLEKLAYRVFTVADGNELAGQDYLSDTIIDLLILDGAAPIEESKEIVRLVRKHCPEAKTVFSTVHDTKLETECGKKIASEKLIQKPYSIHSFSQIVAQALQ